MMRFARLLFARAPHPFRAVECWCKCCGPPVCGAASGVSVPTAAQTSRSALPGGGYRRRCLACHHANSAPPCKPSDDAFRAAICTGVAMGQPRDYQELALALGDADVRSSGSAERSDSWASIGRRTGTRKEKEGADRYVARLAKLWRHRARYATVRHHTRCMRYRWP